MRYLNLFRHGSTKLNNHTWNGDRIRWRKDIPLSDEGIQEVTKWAKDVPSWLIGIITSDLIRTVQTSKILRQALWIPILSKEIGLRPRHLGIFEWQESSKVFEKLSYYIEHPDEMVPEGESFNDFLIRAVNCMNKILKKYPKANVLIVTHHRLERLFRALETGNFIEAEFRKKWDAPGAFCKIAIPK